MTQSTARLTEPYLRRWQLRRDGPACAGAVAQVLPVRQVDGTPAMLKLQPVDAETAGEPVALRAWDGDGAVRLLAHDPDTGTMLLERLAPDRTLASVPDDLAALRILSELLARLVALPAPAGLRRLDEIADELLDRTPVLVPRLPEPDDRRLLRRCAEALAPLLPALRNRWGEVVASGDVHRAVRRRFDLMTEVLGLDRQRAAGWTLARVLQDVLWDLGDGLTTVHPARVAIAHTMLPITG